MVASHQKNNRPTSTAKKNAVIACSALKKTYRDFLKTDSKEIRWIYLKGSYQQILNRLEKRSAHFMKPVMLQSQIQALEEPENAIIINIDLSIAEIIQTIIAKTVP